MGNHASSLRTGLQDDYEAALARRAGAGAAGPAQEAGSLPTPSPHAPAPPGGLALSEVAFLRSPASGRRAWDVGPLNLPLAMALDR